MQAGAYIYLSSMLSCRSKTTFTRVSTFYLKGALKTVSMQIFLYQCQPGVCLVVKKFPQRVIAVCEQPLVMRHLEIPLCTFCEKKSYKAGQNDS